MRICNWRPSSNYRRQMRASSRQPWGCLGQLRHVGHRGVCQNSSRGTTIRSQYALAAGTELLRVFRAAGECSNARPSTPRAPSNELNFLPRCFELVPQNTLTAHGFFLNFAFWWSECSYCPATILSHTTFGFKLIMLTHTCARAGCVPISACMCLTRCIAAH